MPLTPEDAHVQVLVPMRRASMIILHRMGSTIRNTILLLMTAESMSLRPRIVVDPVKWCITISRWSRCYDGRRRRMSIPNPMEVTNNWR